MSCIFIQSPVVICLFRYIFNFFYSFSLFLSLPVLLIHFLLIKLAVLRHEFEGISEKLELTQSELRLANEQLAEMKLTSEENNTLRVHLEEEEVNK